MKPRHTKAAPTNVLCLVRGQERYVWMYDDGRERDVVRQLGKAAANPELSLTWKDAAMLSVKLRERKCG